MPVRRPLRQAVPVYAPIRTWLWGVGGAVRRPRPPTARREHHVTRPVGRGPGKAMFLDVSADVAAHLALAIEFYVVRSQGSGRAVPAELHDFAVALSQTALSRQGPSPLEQLPADQQAGQVNPKVLTTRQAANVLQCSPRTVERLTAAGTLPVVHIGRSARIPVEALDAYLAPTPQGE